ncbi:unnamed protein product [Hermetia illucens]|uniref:ubiquitinyl hydrolase 1 n=1 Tax=Hermetia illucens TaxID=343691 RepID=A0A7R8URQ5_HERIL|nr:uncharacterized protein LOC119651329 isoform X1 [Hermetia illucens]CAD7085791.1 unnamed protein product [Hermetia illucens]
MDTSPSPPTSSSPPSSTSKRQQLFGIATRSCELTLQTPQIICEPKKSGGLAGGLLKAKREQQKVIVSKGTLVKILDANGSSSVNVQVMDYINKNPIWENMYKCAADSVRQVPQDTWPYVIAIADPEERLRFALNSKWCQIILSLKIGSIVSVSAELFKKSSSFDYNCIVRYIGLVPEIGPGYYFGLELLDLCNGTSPQCEDITFLSKYIPCEPTLSLIVASNWINRNSKENKALKFSPKDLLTDTLDKAKTAFGARQSSLRRPKRPKQLRRSGSFDKEKENFPITISPKNLSPSPSNGYSEYENVKTVMDPTKITYSKSTASSGLSSISTKTSGTNSAIYPKRDKSTNTNFDNDINTRPPDKDRRDRANQSNLNNIDEDYAQFIEKKERKLNSLERQIHKQSSSTDTAGGSDSSDKQQPHIPVSILKQSKTKKKLPVHTSTVKPNTIMSYEDRDIVVIDKADIKESTMNESEVIVVQKDVDLAELLGSNWPTNAGEAAVVLNAENSKATAVGSSSSNSSVSSYSTRNDRNKSVNPLSHLIATKNDKRYKENNIMQPGDNNSTATVDAKKQNKNPEPIYDNAPSLVSVTPIEDEHISPSPLSEIPGANLGVGSMVEVSTDVCEDLYGVIRWIGCPQGSRSVMVGVELEDEQEDRPLNLTNGTHNGVRLFRCPENRALFVHPTQCSKDRRFQDIELPQAAAVATASTSQSAKLSDAQTFGQVECPAVPGKVPPLKILSTEGLEEICGKFKGIQGHHNSCYLDATLFSMFMFTYVFDSILFRPQFADDIPAYKEVQKVLREEIVNPLRKNLFVRADRVMKLRQLLDKLSSVSGLTCEEKDPEEFLNSLLAQIMKAEPFLKLNSGQDAFYYQLFVEKDERLSFPSVQQLFEQSFHASDIKLKEVPSCLIIQMPRFGKNFKMYPRILPSQVLDVTDIIEDSPRQCSVCGKLAEYECRDCFGSLQCAAGLESTAFCKNCLDTVHGHSKRSSHTPRKLSVPYDFKIMPDYVPVPRIFMELFAVVCIETSHYVAFVKAGCGQDAPWCFFDSMADRKGEQNGYNIPEMVSVPDLPHWLSEEGARVINEAASNDKMLPEHAKRLLCDAYMCMYQSTDVMMYR